MNDVQWYDVVRVITVTVSLISLFYLGRRAYRYWDLFTVYLKDIWFALLGFQVLLIEGSIEQIIARVHGGPRTVLAVVIALVCLKATRKKDVEFIESWQKASVTNKS